MEQDKIKRDLIAYLYGEMPEEERDAFETYLKDDAQLMKEYEELEGVHKALGQIHDKEVVNPEGALGALDSWVEKAVNDRRHSNGFRWYMAVAASILVFMMVGFFTHFSMKLNDQGLEVSFGKPENGLNEKQINTLITAKLDEQKNQMTDLIKVKTSTYDQQLKNLQASLQQQVSNHKKEIITQTDLKRFISYAEHKNSALIKEYLDMSSSQQQDYFKTMLTQFNEFLQYQRQEDLTEIQTRLVELQKDQQQQKLQTEQAITSLYSTVSLNKN